MTQTLVGVKLIMLDLMAGIVYISDIDECTLGTPDCSHICTNSLGSYQCSCNTGYRLGTDAKSCSGRTGSKING